MDPGFCIQVVIYLKLLFERKTAHSFQCLPMALASTFPSDIRQKDKEDLAEISMELELADEDELIP